MSELELTIDHVTLSVLDLPGATAFYAAALAPLGLDLIAEVAAGVHGPVGFAGFGRGRKGTFWLAGHGQQTPRFHVCFRAASRAAVAAFHSAALAAGGVDNGPPGVREDYHPAYYAAFVLSPEGHNIEAVTFEA
jgi:catechol 2,3-dioxygenase-like lactoylglutathione lyase family enzyme